MRQDVIRLLIERMQKIYSKLERYTTALCEMKSDIKMVEDILNNHLKDKKKLNIKIY